MPRLIPKSFRIRSSMMAIKAKTQIMMVKHFPNEEALAVAGDDSIETGLSAVTDWPAGVPILDALRDHLTGPPDREPARPSPEFVA